jgi:hypothetical protein
VYFDSVFLTIFILLIGGIGAILSFMFWKKIGQRDLLTREIVGLVVISTIVFVLTLWTFIE